MTSFRKKVFVWCGTVLLLLTVSVMGVLIISILYQFYHDERKELQELALSINQVLEQDKNKQTLLNKNKAGNHTPASEGSHEEPNYRKKLLSDSIDRKLSLLFDEDDFNLSYAIFTKNGDLVHKYDQPSSKPFESIVAPKVGFFVTFKTYKNWIFYHYNKGNTYDVLVSSTHHLEIVDKLFISLLLILPIGGLLTVFLSLSLSKKVLIPLQTIVSTTRQIEKGDLSARIPAYQSGDEVENLINRLNSTFNLLESSLQQSRRFIADAAHELRTPVAAIQGHLEVGLRNDQSVDEWSETVKTALEEVTIFSAIVDQMILLERTKSNYFDNQFQTTNFSEILANQVVRLKALREEKKIVFEVDLTPKLSVNGVESLLVQLCNNLMGNAIKFSSENSKVNIVLDRKKECAVLRIRDQGIGIANEDQSKVFEAFYQGDSSRTTGLGLGLSIAKSIVELHKGEIHLESELGKGTTVEVKIPLRPV